MASISVIGKDLAFFENHLSEWLKTQRERVVLIRDAALVGFYDNEDSAFRAGASQFGMSPFFVRRITDAAPTFQAPAYCLGLLRAIR